MRLWTYLWPVGLWLWYAKRFGERIPVSGMTAYAIGRWAVIDTREALLSFAANVANRTPRDRNAADIEERHAP